MRISNELCREAEGMYTKSGNILDKFAKQLLDEFVMAEIGANSIDKVRRHKVFQLWASSTPCGLVISSPI